MQNEVNTTQVKNDNQLYNQLITTKKSDKIKGEEQQIEIAEKKQIGIGLN